MSPKTESSAFDDLLGGFGKGSGRDGSEKYDTADSDFDDLLGRSRSLFCDRYIHIIFQYSILLFWLLRIFYNNCNFTTMLFVQASIFMLQIKKVRKAIKPCEN
jgi:hypothetical protein